MYYDWSEIQAFYDTGFSMRDVVKEFGCAYRTIQNARDRGEFVPRDKNEIRSRIALEKMSAEKPCKGCGVPLENKRRKFCSGGCSSRYRSQEYISKWLRGEASGSAKHGGLRPSIRRFLLAECDFTCQWEGCSFNERNPFSGLPVVQVDHVDGCFDNNQRGNLRVLCPNHHAMTETHGALNMGKGRHLRKLDYIRQKRAINIARYGTRVS